jgi:hypothetical protein
VKDWNYCVHDSRYNIKSSWKTFIQAQKEAKKLAGDGAELVRWVHDGAGGKVFVYGGPRGEFSVSHGEHVMVGSL